MYSQVHCYCDVIEKNSKVVVVFANNPPYISKCYQESMLLDIETQKPIQFNNAVECVNHLSLYGWEVITSTQTNNIVRYTLRNTLKSQYHIKGRLERDLKLLQQYEKNMKK